MLSETIAESYRTGNRPKINSANKFTASRRNMYEHIRNLAGGDKNLMKHNSLSVIKDYLPTLQKYVISQNEVPNKDPELLAKQAYQLRCKQIKHYASAAGISEPEAQILLESEEAERDASQQPDADTYLGGLAAPVGVVGSHSDFDYFDNNPETDNLDPALVMGLLNTATSKINSADLKRAAQNKPAGILGTLGTGGTSQYDSLRSFLQKPENAQIKQQILNGLITDISQIPNFSGNAGGINVLAQDTISQIKQQEIKKMLPYIILGLVLFAVLIFFIARRK
jgi:hypothetical protein